MKGKEGAAMATLERKWSDLVVNLHERAPEKQFTWNTVSLAWFILFLAAGIVLAVVLGGPYPLGAEAALLLLSPLLVPLVTLFIARWEAAFIMVVATSVAVGSVLKAAAWLYLVPYWIGAGSALCFQLSKEWDRAIVLRLGRFAGVRGPGLFRILPFVDTIAKRVDLRIRVTDFAAETTLTLDSVPVTVDALCFWLVWDPEKAVLEVADYVQAVVLSSQTALRAAVSSNDLTTLLANGEKIKEDVRKEVDRKTTEWGVTIQHIEITEIHIPAELEEAMSHIAQAEREKRAHILLSEAEREVALRNEEAALVYRDSPIALTLKRLSVLHEGFQHGNSMVVVPSGLPEELSEDDLFGLKALSELRTTKGAVSSPKQPEGGG